MIQASEQFYRARLDALYTAIEGLDPTLYAFESYERWHRARHAKPEHGATGHLEFWIDLGRQVQFGARHAVYSGAVVVLHRYVPDDDATCQARMHAAIRHLYELLAGWSDIDCRTDPTSAEVELLTGDWLQLIVRMNLTIVETP